MTMISRSSSVRILALLASVASIEAFVPSALTSPVVHRRPVARWRAATIDDTTTNGATATKELTTWECDEEAQCVEVPACDEEQCRTSLDVRIHGEWYDLTGPLPTGCP